MLERNRELIGRQTAKRITFLLPLLVAHHYLKFLQSERLEESKKEYLNTPRWGLQKFQLKLVHYPIRDLSSFLYCGTHFQNLNGYLFYKRCRELLRLHLWENLGKLTGSLVVLDYFAKIRQKAFRKLSMQGQN